MFPHRPAGSAAGVPGHGASLGRPAGRFPPNDGDGLRILAQPFPYYSDMFRVLRGSACAARRPALTVDPTRSRSAQAARRSGSSRRSRGRAGLRILLARRVDNALLFSQSGIAPPPSGWPSRPAGPPVRPGGAGLLRAAEELPAEDAVRNASSPRPGKAVADNAARTRTKRRTSCSTPPAAVAHRRARAQAKARKAAALGDDEARRRAAPQRLSMGTNVQGEGGGGSTARRLRGPLQARLKPWIDASSPRPCRRAPQSTPRPTPTTLPPYACLGPSADDDAATATAGTHDAAERTNPTAHRRRPWRTP